MCIRDSHLFVPIGIIHIQGDDGTAIIYGIIGCCMLFAAGLSWKYIIGAFAALAAAAAVVFAFFSDKIGKGYQWYRILAVIDPNNETGWAPSETIWKNIVYQQQRGEIAIGSGGLLGLGLGKSRQKFLFLPEEHNDCIFSIVCEELGLIGATLIMAIFALLIIRGYWIALHARDRFGSLLVVGITTQIALQVFLNIAVVTNLVPNTGISLPFFSVSMRRTSMRTEA